MKNFPLVSIVCTTYNQEKYIGAALEGFIMQKTNFPFEIVVHDDASTDNAVLIIEEYQKRYPQLFKTIYQEENQYSKGVNIWRNIFTNFCSGKYIAICEGDDYWTDPFKLQKEIDFLEKNPDYGLVYTKARVFIQSKECFSDQLFGEKRNGFKDLLIKGNAIPTLTVCFRKSNYDLYFQDIIPHIWKMSDYPLWLLISCHSKIKFVNEISGTYRIIDNSASHKQDVKSKISFNEDYLKIKMFFSKYSGFSLRSKFLSDYLSFITYLYVNEEINKKELYQNYKKYFNLNIKTILFIIISSNKIGRIFLKKRYIELCKKV